jgi:hypothetical protein
MDADDATRFYRTTVCAYLKADVYCVVGFCRWQRNSWRRQRSENRKHNWRRPGQRADHTAVVVVTAPGAGCSVRVGCVTDSFTVPITY